jgi:hypothetical protein
LIVQVAVWVLGAHRSQCPRSGTSKKSLCNRSAETTSPRWTRWSARAWAAGRPRACWARWRASQSRRRRRRARQRQVGRWRARPRQRARSPRWAWRRMTRCFKLGRPVSAHLSAFAACTAVHLPACLTGCLPACLGAQMFSFPSASVSASAALVRKRLQLDRDNGRFVACLHDRFIAPGR